MMPVLSVVVRPMPQVSQSPPPVGAAALVPPVVGPGSGGGDGAGVDGVGGCAGGDDPVPR